MHIVQVVTCPSNFKNGQSNITLVGHHGVSRRYLLKHSYAHAINEIIDHTHKLDLYVNHNCKNVFNNQLIMSE